MDLLFYLFSSCTLLSGILVIQSRNPVYSVIFLVLVFFNASGLLILLGLDFFAMIFLVVYVGAIAVLFLFVVMMLNIKLTEINEKKLRYLPVGGLLGILFLFEVLILVDNDVIPLLSYNIEDSYLKEIFTQLQFFDWSNELSTSHTIHALGNVIYTYYFYFFLMASIILLVAMIGAIVLTMQKGIHVKRQEIFLQNTRDFTKTIRKIS
ncbi:NADH-quinone oxidoreductase subunit J [Paenibacillus sp. MAHUQ-46]|uniref:NADH-quinone oxidoreductase subunit J n=1 Tax=Paenibacillus roseus TaxID=2798579 RepID=A0A934IYU4_9BACL|nr:NADH-quinone oxidoreductase subunit J [Paenibacillus roseus]MBJ6361727.1 NADH-quinone oxidoreductase subunit J [Paenibacillus roseus]